MGLNARDIVIKRRSIDQGMRHKNSDNDYSQQEVKNQVVN